MDGLRKIDVLIDGVPVRLVSDESDEYIQELADYVGQKLKRIKSGRSFLSMHSQAVLLGFHLADELFKQRAGLAKADANRGEDESRLIRLRDENATLKKKTALLAEELELKAEVLKENTELKARLAETDAHPQRAAELEAELKQSIEKINALEKELADSRRELEEYIRAFDERT